MTLARFVMAEDYVSKLSLMWFYLYEAIWPIKKKIISQNRDC